MQKLPETQKVTRNTKSCQKKIAEQLVSGKPYITWINKTVTKESKQTKIKTNLSTRSCSDFSELIEN